MNIGADLQTIQQRKDPHNQAVYNALQKLGQTATELERLVAQVKGGSAASSPVNTFVGPTIVPPSAAASWTAVNTLTITDGVQGTVIISKSAAGLGLGLKPISILAQFDVIMGLNEICFGNLTNATGVLPEVGLYVTNGTNPAASIAYGLAIASAYGTVVGPQTTPNSYRVSRTANPINVALNPAVTTFQQVCAPLNASPTWFRARANGGNVEFYVGDGLNWVLAYSVAFVPTHFGFGLNPANGGGVASPQTVRLTSCDR